MRTVVFVALLALSLHSCREDDITDTQKQCKEITAHIAEYKQKTINLPATATEGGAVTIYSKGDKLVLATAIAYNESGRSNAQYFFEDEDLICAIQDEYVYNRPVYVTEKRAIEDGDSVWYDDAKTILKTNRFYFYHNRMVKWINEMNIDIPNTNKKYDLQEAILQKDAEKIKKMMIGSR